MKKRKRGRGPSLEFETVTSILPRFSGIGHDQAPDFSSLHSVLVIASFTLGDFGLWHFTGLLAVVVLYRVSGDDRWGLPCLGSSNNITICRQSYPDTRTTVLALYIYVRWTGTGGVTGPRSEVGLVPRLRGLWRMPAQAMLYNWAPSGFCPLSLFILSR